MDDSKKKYIFGMFFLVVLLAFVSLFLAFLSTQNQSVDDSEAEVIASTVVPKEIIISNLTSKSVNISLFTPEEVDVYIKYGNLESAKNVIVRDVRDSNQSGKRSIHYFQVSALKADTEYFFDVYVGNKQYEGYTEGKFKTYKTSESVNVPQSLLVGVPAGFGKGVVYGHAISSSGISDTISVRTEGGSIALTVSNLKDKTGKDFALTNTFIKLSATNSEGKRTSSVFKIDSDKKTLGQVSENTALYIPGATFELLPGANLAITETTNTNTNSTNTSNTNTTSNTSTTVTPVTTTLIPTSTVVTTTATVIPKTALSARDYLLIFPVISLLLGIMLILKKEKKESYY